MSNQRRFYGTTGSLQHNTGQTSSAANFNKPMGTIMEDEIPDRETRGGISAMSKNYSNVENENYANRSGNLLDSSIAEPGRLPNRVEGLTSFLIEEYYRRYGIYS